LAGNGVRLQKFPILSIMSMLQVEINEAELDGILANVKRGKDPPPRVARIQARNALHKKHTERLEQVLRALDNEAITVDQVDGLKEAIEDYLVCSFTT
jgi:CCR4-NOT transcriptional regulation complex NOT5 subunit